MSVFKKQNLKKDKRFNQEKFTRRRTQKKFFFLRKNKLLYQNLCIKTKSTEIVVTRSNNENLNLKFYPAQKVLIPDHIKYKVFKYLSKNKQFAIAVLKKKDGSVDTFGPYYPKRRKRRVIHSEQQIIKQIEMKLRQNKMKDYYELLVYSKYSPCLAREGKEILYKELPIRLSLLKKIFIKKYKSLKKSCRKNKICIKKIHAKKHKVPCMLALDRLSFILGHYYGIKVKIGFSEFYGCTGPITEVIKQHKNDKNSKLGKELQIAKMRIVNVSDLQFHLPKKAFHTFVSQIFNQVKENIPTNKRFEILHAGSKILRETVFTFLDAPQTLKKWEQIGKVIAKQLNEKIGDVMNTHSNKSFVCEFYKKEFEKTWDKTSNESFNNCCDERLNEHINKTAVLLHMKDIQVFKHHPMCFYIPH